MAERYTLPVEKAADLLGVTLRSVARYCEAGARARQTKTLDPRSLDCMKQEKTDRTGEKWLIDPASVERFIRENKVRLDKAGQETGHVETGPDKKAEASSRVQTRPDSDLIAARIQAEAAKWKAKWETEREWRIREREERVEAQKNLNAVAFELGQAKGEIRLLEQRVRLLSSGSRAVENADEATFSGDDETAEAVTSQDSPPVETGEDGSGQGSTPVQTGRDRSSEESPAQPSADSQGHAEREKGSA